MYSIFEEFSSDLVIYRDKKKKKKKLDIESTENTVDKKVSTKEYVETEDFKVETVSIHNIKLMRSTVEYIDNTIEITGKTLVEGMKEMQSKKKEKVDSKTTPYQKRKFIMTRAEKVLYDLIKCLLGNDVIILSKVRLADVVELEGKHSTKNPDFMKIAMKHLDFVILDNEKDLICAVELDDYTHDSERMAKSDAFKTDVLYDCGIPLFRTRKRIDSIDLDDLKPIKKIVLNYYAPKCDVCGRGMEVRETYKRVMFYGCKGFPNNCRNTTSI